MERDQEDLQESADGPAAGRTEGRGRGASSSSRAEAQQADEEATTHALEDMVDATDEDLHVADLDQDGGSDGNLSKKHPFERSRE